MDPPVAFASANNRLMMEIVEQVSGVVPQETRTLLRTKWYYYNDAGNVTRVVTNEAEAGVPTTTYSATRMEYAFNQRAVSYAIGETWDLTQGVPSNYAMTYARQFRYDGTRARYAVRELDPVIPWTDNTLNVLSDTWTDYDGDQPYGEFTVSGGVATNVRSHDLAMGGFDWSGGLPDAPTATYAHRDMIGTMRMTSTAGGSILGGPIFTAFGELRLGPDTRFGYAGAHGYQTDTTGESPFLHLGHRYYDSESGRFLQRDPSGISGGLDVYVYVGNTPTIAVDPEGLDKFEIWQRQRDKAILDGTYDRKRAREEDAARAGGALAGVVVWVCIYFRKAFFPEFVDLPALDDGYYGPPPPPPPPPPPKVKPVPPPIKFPQPPYRKAA